MKKKLYGIPVWYLVIVSAVSASIIISGVVISEIIMPELINVGQRMVNEEAVYIIASVEQTVSDSLNLSVTCLGMDAVSMKLTKPIGSDSPSNIDLNLNATNIINEQGKKLETGNVTLTIRGIKQGSWNCTMVAEVTNQTLITWVDSL